MIDIISRIKAFENEIEPYCPGLNKSLGFRLDSYKHNATLYVQRAQDIPAVQKIVSNYKDIINFADIYENLPSGLIEQNICDFQFDRLQQLISQDIRQFIQATLNNEFNKEIYCLNVWIDVGNLCIDYHFNNAHTYTLALAAKQNSDAAKYYISQHDVINYKYYQHTSTNCRASAQVDALLDKHRISMEQNSRRFGQAFVSRIDEHYPRYFVDHVANAINQLRPQMNQLNITQNFIAYIRFYDESLLTHYYALRKTVELERVKEILTPLYQGYF